MIGTRFQMRLDPWWRPLLLVGGATLENSYAQVDADDVEVRFGFFSRRTIARSEIESAAKADWPLWLGVGWRTNFGDRYGLIGSYRGVVELQLSTPIRVLGVLRASKLAISLDEPEAFLEELGFG